MDKQSTDSKHLLHLYTPFTNNFIVKGALFFLSDLNPDSESQQIHCASEKVLKKVDFVRKILLYSDSTIKVFNIIYQSNFPSGENASFEFDLVQEFQMFGYIQSIVLFHKFSKPHFVCSFDESKVTTHFFDIISITLYF